MKTTLQNQIIAHRFDGLIVRFVFLFLFCFSGFNLTSQAQVKRDFDIAKKLPAASLLRFTENKGQVADMNTAKPRPDVLYTSAGSGVELFFHATGIDYQFSREFMKPKSTGTVQPADNCKLHLGDIDSIQTYRLELQLLGANAHATIIKEAEGRDFENYYLPQCPLGILQVKSYEKITYKEIYPNIDWVIYSQNGMLKYDFIVRPGGNVNNIRMKYNGSKQLGIVENGSLSVTTPFGNLSEKKPYSFQDAGTEIPSEFNLLENIVSFKVGQYDKSKTLNIDPSIIWGTYYGGLKEEHGYACKTDQQGNVYMVGFTYSPTGISSGGFQNTINGTNTQDAFMVKFAADGTRLWGTYYGGSMNDQATSCDMDVTGNIYMSGNTRSSDVIALGGFQNTYGGGITNDIFLVKFAPDGSRIWGTYFGGTQDDGSFANTIDASGNIYVSGMTYSPGLGYNGFQNAFGGGARNGLLIKFAPDGSRLWATYYGGATGADVYGCCADAAGNVFISGSTFATTGIASGGFQNVINANGDAFLVKFAADGTRLWGTYYGGEGWDLGISCATDNTGNIYLVGTTGSLTSISFCGFQNNYGGGINDLFLVKFTNAGARIWATYYGGPAIDAAIFSSPGVMTDASGNVYLSGNTNSLTGIAFNGFQNTCNLNSDGFVVKFTGTCTRIWGTYYGGTSVDYLEDMTLDPSGNIYLCGSTGSANNIASGGFDNTVNAGQDAFLVKIANPALPAPDIQGISGCMTQTGYVITINGNNFTGATNVTFGDVPAASFIVLNASTISATVGAGATGSVAVTTAYGTASLCGFVYCSTASVSITANPGNLICTGTPVTFTATPVNGGSSPVYQWKKNGINVGINSATYTDNSLVNGDAILCTYISTSSCTQCSPFSSNTISMTVSGSASPSVSIVSSANNICTGTNVTFTATPVNGGTLPSYQWHVNGMNVGTNSATFTTATLVNNDIVSCTLTSNSACASPLTVASNNINMVVTASLVSSITISTSANNICAGTSVIFTATSVNGGTLPSYQWHVNGMNVGTNSATFTTATLVNNDIVSCTLTSNSACASPLTVTSNNINMIVTASVVPSITISTSANNICAGTSVTFTATPVNGGTSASYQWHVNGMNVGTNSSTFTTATLVDNDIVSCILTSNSACASTLTALSNNINMIVNASLVPSITISTSANNICAGTSVTFTATPVNGGTLPSYQWHVNGMNVGTNSATFTTATLVNNDIVSCTLTSNSACASPLTVASNNINMVVTASLVPSVTISTSANNICAGTSVIFTATPVNGGTSASYQWHVNGMNVGTNSATFTTTTLVNNDIVSCTLTSNSACASPLTVASNNINMVVTASLVPSITISASANNICAGTSVIFTATPVNGGTLPSYQWHVNGMNVGTNSATFTTATLINNDIVSCTLTSNSACASPLTALSNNINMIVTASVVPSITISTSANNICAGTSVIFTATPVNGGTSPSYQWHVNGMNVGTNSPTFTTATLVNNDIVSCTLTSNSACASPLTVASNNINMVVNASATSSITISASAISICKGANVTFTAVPFNGGSIPSYQWQVNGIVTGANSTTLTIGSLTNGAVITCVFTPGVGSCPGTAVTSNSIIVDVYDMPVISVTPPEATISAGAQVQLSASVLNTASYEWSPSNALVNATLLNPLTAPLNVNTDFIFRAISSHGCMAEQKVKVYVLWKLFMPTTFTPNVDGINDVFRIPPQAEFDLKELIIYNRWGKKIFTTTTRQLGWDGTFSGLPCETGTYVYFLSGRDKTGIVNIKGNIILTR